MNFAQGLLEFYKGKQLERVEEQIAALKAQLSLLSTLENAAGAIDYSRVNIRLRKTGELAALEVRLKNMNQTPK